MGQPNGKEMTKTDTRAFKSSRSAVVNAESLFPSIKNNHSMSPGAFSFIQNSFPLLRRTFWSSSSPEEKDLLLVLYKVSSLVSMFIPQSYPQLMVLQTKHS